MRPDRRRATRYSLPAKGRLIFVDNVLHGQLVDVSPAGMALRFPGEPNLRVGGQVGICHLEFADLTTPLNGFVSLMRLEASPGSYVVGCRLDSMEDEPLSLLQTFQVLAKARMQANGQGRTPDVG